MDPSTFLQFFVNGVLQGCIYALAALGLTLIFGVYHFVNLAHGFFIMLAAYLVLQLCWWGVTPILACIIATILVVLVGFLAYLLGFSRLFGASFLAQIVSSFGLAIIIENSLSLIWKSDVKVIHILSGAISIGNVMLPISRITSAIFSVAATLLFFLMLSKTRLGKAIRAVSQDPEGASLLAVNVNFIRMISFIISCALAGFAGTLLGQVSAFAPHDGHLWTFRAFAIAQLGGLGSFTGAIIGGLIIGLLESFSVLWISAGYVDAIFFGALLVMVLLRPTGILGVGRTR